MAEFDPTEPVVNGSSWDLRIWRYDVPQGAQAVISHKAAVATAHTNRPGDGATARASSPSLSCDTEQRAKGLRSHIFDIAFLLGIRH
jgi:hypothetical protein